MPSLKCSAVGFSPMLAKLPFMIFEGAVPCLVLLGRRCAFDPSRGDGGAPFISTQKQATGSGNFGAASRARDVEAW